MVDICAEAANIDPFSYRKKLLKNHPRLLNVLNTLEDFSHSEKESRGVAIWHSFQSNIGVTATASYDPQNQTVTIPRVYCVVDCGTPVNPDNIINQMEGSVVFALSAFYFGEITLDQGKVVQSNFNDYKMAKLSHTPEIKVHIIDSTERPGGMGEPGVPASIAAMANAVSKATCIRITELPIIKMGIKPMA
jgi:isoquinoline 1-oxidoreductase beta subunit